MWLHVAVKKKQMVGRDKTLCEIFAYTGMIDV